MRKKQFIKDLKKDDIVSDIFVVKFKKPVEQYKNGFRFELRIADSSKEIMYKYWGPADEAKVRALYDSVKKNDVVLVTGRVNEWNEQLEISANERDQIRVLGKEEYDLHDFVRSSKKPIDVMWQDLLSFVDSIKDDDISKVVRHFFYDEGFAKDFRECPAAMYIHHGWIGGLLEHTLSVVQLLGYIHKVHDSLDRDLMIAGGLLHDIGKLREFETKTSIDVTKEGMLIGHVSIGCEMLEEVFRTCDTPQELRMKLKHILITHMGEYGSSKTPAFPEAMAVYYSDQTDARITQMQSFKEDAQTEDDFIYSKHLGNVYLR